MINIAICDDSTDFQEIIKHKIIHCIQNKFQMECTIQCFGQLEEFKLHLENNKVDIAFLDIMVNDINSMDWSINNIQSNYTQLIFMTSYPQYAYNLSETNCCYYIIKSRMTDETLTNAIKRALQNTTKKDPNLTIISFGSKNYIINFQDIVYIETFSNNLVLHIKNADNITIYSTLKEYSEKLPPNFLRCHKSYMVNMNHISGYEPHKFRVSSNKEIPIPPKKYNEIIEIYKNYLRAL